MRIEILGSGCPKCRATEKVMREQVEARGLEAEILHVTDPREIQRHRVVFTPAVVIDGKVVVSGHVPTREEAARFLSA